jgi:hypothetical protein
MQLKNFKKTKKIGDMNPLQGCGSGLSLELKAESVNPDPHLGQSKALEMEQ